MKFSSPYNCSCNNPCLRYAPYIPTTHTASRTRRCSVEEDDIRPSAHEREGEKKEELCGGGGGGEEGKR